MPDGGLVRGLDKASSDGVIDQICHEIGHREGIEVADDADQGVDGD
jgi:hypothetical protein